MFIRFFLALLGFQSYGCCQKGLSCHGGNVSNHAGDVVDIAEDSLQPLRVAACFLGQVSEARCMVSERRRLFCLRLFRAHGC